MITQLVIRNFKKFSSKDLTFSPGINVIRGDNEAGKSTIMAAILATLFTDVNTKSKSFFDGVLSWKTQSRDIYLEAHFVNPTASHTLAAATMKRASRQSWPRSWQPYLLT